MEYIFPLAKVLRKFAAYRLRWSQINVRRAIQIVAIMITNDFALQRHIAMPAKCRRGATDRSLNAVHHFNDHR